MISSYVKDVVDVIVNNPSKFIYDNDNRYISDGRTTVYLYYFINSLNGYAIKYDCSLIEQIYMWYKLRKIIDNLSI